MFRTVRAEYLTNYNNAERRAATASGARYISTTPWFCAKRCNAVIGNHDVYFNPYHVAVGYSEFLEGVLAESFNLTSLGPPH